MKKMNENYFAVIPLKVLRLPISANAKLLFGEITALTKKSGECIATNKHFADILGVSERTISSLVGELVENELINTDIEQDGSGTWRTIYPIFQWGGRRNLREGVEDSFVPKESNTKRINITASSSLEETNESEADITIEPNEDELTQKELRKKESIKAKGYDSGITNEVYEWAMKMSGRKYLNPMKQKAAISKMLKFGYTKKQIQEKYEELLNNGWTFDFMTVANQFDKAPRETKKPKGAVSGWE